MDGVISFLYFLLGAYLVVFAVSVRRPGVFKFKVGFVATLPFTLSILTATQCVYNSPQYTIILTQVFCALLLTLYWREVHCLVGKVKYQKNFTRQLADVAPDLIWAKDLDRRFIYVNHEICDRLLLLPREKAIGKTSSEIAEYHRKRGMVYTFGEVCCDSDTETLERMKVSVFLEHGLVDGKLLVLQVYKAPLYDKHGKLIGTVGVGRDMTYDFLDHREIWEAYESNKCDDLGELLLKHMNRFQYHQELFRYQAPGDIVHADDDTDH